MMKLVPIKSLVGELSHRFQATAYPRDIPDVPLHENIKGSEDFVALWRRSLQYIAEKAPHLYAELVANVRYIEEWSLSKTIADPLNRTILAQYIDHGRELDEQDTFEKATTIIHEAAHISLHVDGLFSAGVYAEAFCVSKEIEFAQWVQLPASIPNGIAQSMQQLDRIDIPEYQWWR